MTKRKAKKSCGCLAGRRDPCNPGRDEIELWVLNDESLYRWWKSERVGMRKFISNNSGELKHLIRQALRCPGSY